eukprot:TRINITY_DN26217_c0_g4_i1.p1 TRINITY_DN26217_c0_g4~~TRINITY_DN26217_c0_g4_i1.p1  ORF type:complete len:762 (+),score=165.05 TRINITY_DN26217_c0_g4_i1:117-2402(+)
MLAGSFSSSLLGLGGCGDLRATTVSNGVAAQSVLESTGWEEVSTLGSGARGAVLLVRRRSGGEKCALKRSTLAEVRALKALSRCRNVVRLFETFATADASSAADELWARLEWLEGGSLRDYLRSRRDQKVSDVSARFLLSELLRGLEDIHKIGWMHRDVKAENVGLSSGITQGCRVRLLDFDVATEVPGGRSLHEVVGTVENMAPEVFEGAYDERADCWSLGVIAYEVLFGYRPFNDACIDQVEEMVRNWRRYLLLPFDAAEAPASFVRCLLTGAEDRMTCTCALEHAWLNEGSGCGMSLAAELPPSYATSRRSSMPSCLEPRSAPQGYHVAWPPVAGASAGCAAAESPPHLGGRGGDSSLEVDSLSRIRQSLSTWHSSFSGRVSAGGMASAVVSTDHHAGHRGMNGPAPATRAGRAQASTFHPDVTPRGAELGPSAAEIRAEEESHADYLLQVRKRTEEMLRSAATAASQANAEYEANKREREEQRAAHVEPARAEATSAGDASETFGAEPEQMPPSPQKRSPGVAAAMAELEDKQETASSLSHLREVRERTRAITSLMAAEYERRRVEAEAERAQERAQTQAPRAEAAAAAAPASAVPIVAPAPISTPTSPPPAMAPAQDSTVGSLSHLRDVRERTRELLRRMTAVSLEEAQVAPAAASPAAAAAVSPASAAAAPRSPAAGTDEASDPGGQDFSASDVSDGGPGSPTAYLRAQRTRTQQLLWSLRAAAYDEQVNSADASSHAREPGRGTLAVESEMTTG